MILLTMFEFALETTACEQSKEVPPDIYFFKAVTTLLTSQHHDSSMDVKERPNKRARVAMSFNRQGTTAPAFHYMAVLQRTWCWIVCKIYLPISSSSQDQIVD